MNDPEVVLVHVTHYNKLMWYSTVPRVKVIEHGVTEPVARYSGELGKGIVVINHIRERGRIAGWDIFEQIRKKIPLDLVGMGTEHYGGLGEILHPQLPAFTARYRFFFNPMRYTSFGLAVCEAMMMGMPIAALATTEYGAVLKDGYTGFVHTNIDKLMAGMQALLDDPALARRHGQHAMAMALDQFNIQRFIKEWESMFRFAINTKKLTYGTNSFYQ
jgi:glycosyltransferase involved in cell wall biosynthesis